MKIVLPVHHFPPRYSAGAELYTFRLARALLHHGHEVEVVCVERIDDPTATPINAVRDSYQGVPVWRLSFDLSQAPDPLCWSYDNPLIGAWFADYLATAQPDLVHLQSGYLMTVSVLDAARAQEVPTVLTLHDFWFLCPRITLLRGDGSLCTSVPDDPRACEWCLRSDSRRYRYADQLTGGLVSNVLIQLATTNPQQPVARRRARLAEALSWPAAVIAPSRSLAQKFEALVQPERLRVLRLGIDTSLLQLLPYPPNNERLHLGYIGQIAPHKGVHVLVQALRMLPIEGKPLELTIYGDLDQQPEYGRKLRHLIGADQRIRVAGRFANGRIAEVLSDIDATVVPSIWYENSPLAILEAQAARRPVLTSALGGMAELVRDEIDGLHFRPGDAADLARQIQRLRAEPTLLPRLRQGSVAPATVDDEMRTLLGIYRDVLERRALSAEWL